ncbi:MAG: hypothetical protein KC503_16845 [Myxococcales bacterium]|nr:hypothetical protein [Myxococcales bacterium]
MVDEVMLAWECIGRSNARATVTRGNDTASQLGTIRAMTQVVPRGVAQA